MSDEKPIGKTWYEYSEKEVNDKWDSAVEKFINSPIRKYLDFNVKTNDKTIPEGDTTLAKKQALIFYFAKTLQTQKQL